MYSQVLAVPAVFPHGLDMVMYKGTSRDCKKILAVVRCDSKSCPLNNMGVSGKLVICMSPVAERPSPGTRASPVVCAAGTCVALKTKGGPNPGRKVVPSPWLLLKMGGMVNKPLVAHSCSDVAANSSDDFKMASTRSTMSML